MWATAPAEPSTADLDRIHQAGETEREAALLALIARFEEPGEDREQVAMELSALLGDMIRGIARRVANGSNPALQQEFVEESLSLVLGPRDTVPPVILSFDPAIGSLATFLRTVLRRAWLSASRRESIRRPSSVGHLHTGIDREGSDVGIVDSLAGKELLSTPLSPSDLRQIENWPAHLRPELLCLGGLWHLVPSGIWERWLGEYEQRTGVQLDRPFPPEEMSESWDDMAEWARCFRSERINTLSVRKCREKHRLAQLDRVRQLCESSR